MSISNVSQYLNDGFSVASSYATVLGEAILADKRILGTVTAIALGTFAYAGYKVWTREQPRNNDNPPNRFSPCQAASPFTRKQSCPCCQVASPFTSEQSRPCRRAP